MSPIEDAIWISWEDHRRSRELAKSLGVLYTPLVISGSRYKRYLVLGLKTIRLVSKIRPKYVFCQNPSIVLAALVLMLRPLFNYKLVVDRHSNFKFEYNDSPLLKWRFFHYLSRLTIKKADLTIVTNTYLNDLCLSLNGRSVILQDKIPELSLIDKGNPPNFMDFSVKKFHIMTVTMFDDDEPIEEIVSAGMALPKEYIVYLTGDYRKRYSECQREEFKSHGVIMTGFIEESEYQSLMFHSDVVVVLTKKDHILNCGAYEAYSLRKPLVLSDTEALREYFSEGCLYAVPNSKSIGVSIKQAVDERKTLVDSMNRFTPQLESEWVKRFEELKQEIGRI